MKAATETVCRSEAGRLFQTLGPAMEKARSPSLVRVLSTAAAPFVVDLRDRVDEKLREVGWSSVIVYVVHRCGDLVLYSVVYW